jgi:transposase-like protein
MAKGRYEEWLTDDGLLLLEGWKRNGLTDEQIAHNIGINVATLYTWKNKYSEIDKALKRGKEVVDLEVENALLKSACGHYVTVKKAIKVKTEKQLQGKGKIVEEHIEYVDEQVYIPPSNTAQIFWLKNRKPEQWREKQATSVELYEDDGLIAALNQSVEDAEDDSYMIPEEEDSNND